MKVSELLAQLQLFLDEHGDCEVLLNPPGHGYITPEEVAVVDYPSGVSIRAVIQ